MRCGSCLGLVGALFASIVLCGCQTPEADDTNLPLGVTREAAAPPPPSTEGLTPNEAVRLQYRRMRAKELVEEAKILQTKHRYAEASKKMAEAHRLLEGIPE